MIFMKTYALLAVASACFLITSCTTDDLENQNVETSSNTIQNDYFAKTADSTSIESNPLKTKGKDD
jgi:outer membrane biogenesis lipoprotein LolB